MMLAAALAVARIDAILESVAGDLPARPDTPEGRAELVGLLRMAAVELRKAWAERDGERAAVAGLMDELDAAREREGE